MSVLLKEMEEEEQERRRSRRRGKELTGTSPKVETSLRGAPKLKRSIQPHSRLGRDRHREDLTKDIEILLSSGVQRPPHMHTCIGREGEREKDAYCLAQSLSTLPLELRVHRSHLVGQIPLSLPPSFPHLLLSADSVRQLFAELKGEDYSSSRQDDEDLLLEQRAKEEGGILFSHPAIPFGLTD